MPEPAHTTILVPSDAEIEIVRDDCDCAEGAICGADDPFATGCPRLARLAALALRDT